MRDFPGVRRMFRLATGRGALRQAIDEELAFHLETTAEELVAEGMNPTEARAEAQRRFGNLGRRRAELLAVDGARDARDRWSERFAALRQDIGFALRGVRRNPGFALLVALTLGLGVGVNAAMLGILNHLFFEPPAHIADSERVRKVYFVGASSSNWSDIHDLVAAHSFSGISAYAPVELTYGTGERTTKLHAQIVSPTFFSLLGAPMFSGRPLIPADDSLPRTGSAAVVSYGFWRRQLGGDPHVLGRVLDIGEGHYTVIGVATEGFTGAEQNAADVWLPLRGAAAEVEGGDWEHSRGYYWLVGLARLKPGVTTETGESEATRLHRRAREGTKDDDHVRHVTLASLIEARGPGRPREATVYVWVAGVSLIVLIIAGANVANLLLLRAMRRRRETAVRLALGISRARLVGHLLAESVVLALLGAAGALVLGAVGGQFFHRLMLDGNSTFTLGLDRTTIVLTITLALVAGIAAGLAPAALESRPDLTRSLRSSGASGRRSALQSALLILQATLSVILLVGAGLFVQSLRAVRGLDLGMSTSNVLLVQPEFASTMTPARQSLFLDDGIERIRHLAGVQDVAVSGSIPFWSSYAIDLSVPGLDSIPSPKDGGPYVNAVTPAFLSTMGMTLARGRWFREQDGRGAPAVTVIGEAMAALLWPGQNALGKCMKIGGDTMPCSEVIGIVRDPRRQNLFEERTVQYYVPKAQRWNDDYQAAFFVRTTGRPETLAAPVQRALHDASAEVRYIETRPLQDLIEPQLRAWSLGATLFTLFGGLALLVAAVGLYSIMSFEVTRRSRELGIRSALGASARTILALVLGDGLRLVSLGIILGVALTLLVAPAGATLLYGVSPREPMVYVLAAGVLLVAALVAGIFPAVRASRVDPNQTLRAE